MSTVQSDLKKYASAKRAKASLWFFKTGKGQYGEGDIFIGVSVPHQRRVARLHRDLPLADVEKLLRSPVHEHRLTALFILVDSYRHADIPGKERIYTFYLSHTICVNNWDLVDSSAGYIVGEWLADKKSERKILYLLSKSKNIWERRIAIIATQAFIVRNDFADTLKIAETLLSDTHDLIHKAVGWMLREVGKRDQTVEEAFLKTHYRKMPRTMLRYAIEKFSSEKKAFYMEK